MKKLFALVALVGMGAFLAGCGDDKPAAPKTGGTPAGMSPTKGGVEPGPKAGDSKGKADMADDGDKPDADKPDADKPDDDKPDADKPEGEDK